MGKGEFRLLLVIIGISGLLITSDFIDMATMHMESGCTGFPNESPNGTPTVIVYRSRVPARHGQDLHR